MRTSKGLESDHWLVHSPKTIMCSSVPAILGRWSLGAFAEDDHVCSSVPMRDAGEIQRRCGRDAGETQGRRREGRRRGDAGGDARTKLRREEVMLLCQLGRRPPYPGGGGGEAAAAAHRRRRLLGRRLLRVLRRVRHLAKTVGGEVFECRGALRGGRHVVRLEALYEKAPAVISQSRRDTRCTVVWRCAPLSGARRGDEAPRGRARRAPPCAIA